MGLANGIFNLNQSSQFVTDVALDASLAGGLLETRPRALDVALAASLSTP